MATAITSAFRNTIHAAAGMSYHALRDLECSPSPAVPSRFEQLVESLNLSPDRLAESTELRKWATKNACRYYVPEELLLAWGITVDEYLSREADLSTRETEKRCRA